MEPSDYTDYVPPLYRVVYRLIGDYHTIETHDGPREFMYGFWVNSKYEFTRGSDCIYWIPPHKVQHIEKMDRN